VSGAAAALEASALFGGVSAEVLADIARLMTPTAYGAGDTVFAEGDRGHTLIVLERGQLEALLRVRGRPPRRVAQMSTGQIVGELSLLADGRRTATVRATTPATAWVLERSAFDVLRRDVRSPVATVVGAIGRSAVQRLERLYRRFGAELGVDENRGAGDPGDGDAVEVEPEPRERAYLASTLFFGDFEPGEVAQVTRGVRRLAYERGMLVAPADRMPEAVWIVARSAVETSIRGAHGRRGAARGALAARARAARRPRRGVAALRRRVLTRRRARAAARRAAARAVERARGRLTRLARSADEHARAEGGE
jgi:hypothetical protein